MCKTTIKLRRVSWALFDKSACSFLIALFDTVAETIKDNDGGSGGGGHFTGDDRTHPDKRRS